MRGLAMRAGVLACAAALALSGCSSSGDEEQAEADSVPCQPDGGLKIGNVLPQTGSLVILGPPEFAGSQLAVNEINAANGVLGKPVESFNGDSGDTTTDLAATTTDEMLQRGVDVIVGAASSAVTKTIIDKITSAGVLQISPANTSTEFIDWPDKGMYFRTAPADQFQGAVLAEVATTDGVTRPAVLARQDSYGESLANTFVANFTASGGALATDAIIYDPEADAFESEVGQVKAASPDGIVLIGFDESSKIIQEMIKQGIGPDKVKLFMVDGNLSNSRYQDLAPGIMAGAKGTLPGAEAADDFRTKLIGIDPSLTDFSYGAEAYDAVNLVALSAVAANSDCGRDIAAKMTDVASGGTPCTTYAECSGLLSDGVDIDYQGRSGPVDFADNGDPSKAVMGVYVYGSDNKYTAEQFVSGDVPDLPAQ